MKRELESALAKYGQGVTLVRSDGSDAQEIRAFVQPIRKRREQPAVGVTPLGGVSEERWLCIASAAIAPGERIECAGLRLTAQETQRVFVGDELLYYRAILQPERMRPE